MMELARRAGVMAPKVGEWYRESACAVRCDTGTHGMTVAAWRITITHIEYLGLGFEWRLPYTNSIQLALGVQSVINPADQLSRAALIDNFYENCSPEDRAYLEAFWMPLFQEQLER